VSSSLLRGEGSAQAVENIEWGTPSCAGYRCHFLTAKKVTSYMQSSSMLCMLCCKSNRRWLSCRCY
jgi:hypothetical protein